MRAPHQARQHYFNWPIPERRGSAGRSVATIMKWTRPSSRAGRRTSVAAVFRLTLAALWKCSFGRCPAFSFLISSPASLSMGTKQSGRSFCFCLFQTFWFSGQIWWSILRRSEVNFWGFFFLHSKNSHLHLGARERRKWHKAFLGIKPSASWQDLPFGMLFLLLTFWKVPFVVTFVCLNKSKDGAGASY